MSSKLSLFINTQHGKYIISVILGLGLESLFRKACNARNCLVFKAPTLSEIKDNIFKFNNKCFKFREKTVSCSKDKNEKTVEFE